MKKKDLIPDIPDDAGFEMLYSKQPPKFDFSGIENVTLIIIENINTLNYSEPPLMDMANLIGEEEDEDGESAKN